MEQDCTYCNHPIDRNANGWGYYIIKEGKLVYFHTECCEIEEQVVIGI